MKKYLVFGGEVKSKTDGDIHYISPSRVAELYELDPRECVFVDIRRRETFLGYDGLISLFPLNSGRYKQIAKLLKKGAIK